MAMPARSAMRTATLRDRKGASDQVPVPAHVVLKYGTQCSCRSLPYTRPTYLVTLDQENCLSGRRVPPLQLPMAESPASNARRRQMWSDRFPRTRGTWISVTGKAANIAAARQLAGMMHHHGSGSVTWLVSQDWMCSVTACPASSWSHCQAGTVASVRFCRWKDQPTKVVRGGGTESYDPPPDLLRPDVLVPASSGSFMACCGSPSEPAATLLSPGSTSRM